MKAVFFDFDGTLTQKGKNLWKATFELLGYDVTSNNGEYKSLFRDFLSGKIDYKEWCDQTCECYRARGFSKEMLQGLILDIKLLDGVKQTFETLQKQNIKVCILSGNFVEIIKYVLGDLTKYVSKINANSVEFDKNGIILKINSTNYDFEGKAKFIADYCSQNKINPQDVLFVGNADNDEWAYQSGCKTLCVNPDKTDGQDTKKWHYCIEKMQNMTEILPIITKIKGE